MILGVLEKMYLPHIIRILMIYAEPLRDLRASSARIPS
jgi:hypothetical protein